GRRRELKSFVKGRRSMLRLTAPTPTGESRTSSRERPAAPARSAGQQHHARVTHDSGAVLLFSPRARAPLPSLSGRGHGTHLVAAETHRRSAFRILAGSSS